MTIPTKYENGVFRPLEIVKIREGTWSRYRFRQIGKPRGTRPSIRNLPFYGMWRDRGDIVDGLDYVNRLRNNPHV